MIDRELLEEVTVIKNQIISIFDHIIEISRDQSKLFDVQDRLRSQIQKLEKVILKELEQNKCED